MTGSIALVEVSIFLQSFSAGNHRIMLVDLDFHQTIERGLRTRALLIRKLIYEFKKSIKNYEKIT